MSQHLSTLELLQKVAKLREATNLFAKARREGGLPRAEFLRFHELVKEFLDEVICRKSETTLLDLTKGVFEELITGPFAPDFIPIARFAEILRLPGVDISCTIERILNLATLVLAELEDRLRIIISTNPNGLSNPFVMTYKGYALELIGLQFLKELIGGAWTQSRSRNFKVGEESWEVDAFALDSVGDILKVYIAEVKSKFERSDIPRLMGAILATKSFLENMSGIDKSWKKYEFEEVCVIAFNTLNVSKIEEDIRLEGEKNRIKFKKVSVIDIKLFEKMCSANKRIGQKYLNALRALGVVLGQSC